MNLILFIFIAYGITNIVVYSSIFEKTRLFFLRFTPKTIGKLITCPMCFSTWVGFLLGTLGWYYATGILNPMLSISIDLITTILSVVLTGFFSSGTVWFVHNLEELFERLN